mgnify:CR=1 FL=1
MSSSLYNLSLKSVAPRDTVEKMPDWTEKYRPTTLADVRGNNKSVKQLREWAEDWDSGEEREPALVHGEPGVGKTSAVHALANDMGWTVVEMNASDARTADAVEEVAGEATRSAGLTGGRTLVVMDEADNLHGNADRGGSGAVTEMVKSASQPVVLIANDIYEMSRTLRNACREIEFRNVSSRSIVPVLRDICRDEDIEFEKEALKAIADANSGDLRGAVHDLQAVAEGRDRLTVEDVRDPINVMRTIRSFDPCLACSVHVDSPEGSYETELKPASPGGTTDVRRA